jgi:hypothetical protein
VNVPVLARVVEASGVPTVTVTMMPVYADRQAVPRIVGVPFPFGQPFGMVGDQEMQLEVLRSAVDLVATATGPVRRDLDIEWPVDARKAYKSWQPPVPSPIVAHSLALIRQMRRAAVEGGG